MDDQTKPMMPCPECSGQGGWFADRADSRGEHYTDDSMCGSCGGTGEVAAECDCGAPGEHEVPVVRPHSNGYRPINTGWKCSECHGDPDRTVTAPLGNPAVPMAELVQERR